MNKEVQQPDTLTYIARVIFLLMSLIALINCYRVERLVHDFHIQFYVADFWIFCTLGGGIVWKAFKRGQMDKRVADVVLMLVGVILMNGGEAIGRLVEFVK
jgi:Na+/proline symporter